MKAISLGRFRPEMRLRCALGDAEVDTVEQFLVKELELARSRYSDAVADFYGGDDLWYRPDPSSRVVGIEIADENLHVFRTLLQTLPPAGPGERSTQRLSQDAHTRLGAALEAALASTQLLQRTNPRGYSDLHPSETYERELEEFLGVLEEAELRALAAAGRSAPFGASASDDASTPSAPTEPVGDPETPPASRAATASSRSSARTGDLVRPGEDDLPGASERSARVEARPPPSALERAGVPGVRWMLFLVAVILLTSIVLAPDLAAWARRPAPASEELESRPPSDDAS